MKHEIRVQQVISTRRMDGCFFRSQDLTLEILGLRGLHTVPHLKSLNGAKKHFKGCIRYLRIFQVLQTIFVSPKYHIEQQQKPPTLHCTLGNSLLTKSHYFCFLPLSPQQEHFSPTFGGPGNLRLGSCMQAH